MIPQSHGIPSPNEVNSGFETSNNVNHLRVAESIDKELLRFTTPGIQHRRLSANIASGSTLGRPSESVTLGPAASQTDINSWKMAAALSAVAGVGLLGYSYHLGRDIDTSHIPV
jgi:hypothetical protein